MTADALEVEIFIVTKDQIYPCLVKFKINEETV